MALIIYCTLFLGIAIIFVIVCRCGTSPLLMLLFISKLIDRIKVIINVYFLRRKENKILFAKIRYTEDTPWCVSLASVLARGGTLSASTLSTSAHRTNYLYIREDNVPLNVLVQNIKESTDIYDEPRIYIRFYNYTSDRIYHLYYTWDTRVSGYMSAGSADTPDTSDTSDTQEEEILLINALREAHHRDACNNTMPLNIENDLVFNNNTSSTTCVSPNSLCIYPHILSLSLVSTQNATDGGDRFQRATIGGELALPEQNLIVLDAKRQAPPEDTSLSHQYYYCRKIYDIPLSFFPFYETLTEDQKKTYNLKILYNDFTEKSYALMNPDVLISM